MTNEGIIYTGVITLGILLGTFFYGGLYFTTKKGLISNQPALWFALSALIRMTVTLLGFYLVAGHDWKRLMMCVAGFIISKPLVIRLAKQWDHFSRLSKITDNETEY